MHRRTPTEAPNRTVWRCPECGHVPLTADGSDLVCHSCDATYPVVSGTPVLIRRDNEVFRRENYTGARPSPRARSRIRSLIPDPSVNLSAERVVPRLTSLLADREAPSAVLLVGSGSVRPDEQRLRTSGLTSDVVAFNVELAS